MKIGADRTSALYILVVYFMVKMFFLLILSVSCSGIPLFNKADTKNDEIKLTNYSHYESSDYIDHLVSLKDPYLDSRQIKKINLRRKSLAYLTRISDKIIKNNELFFKNSHKVKFYLLDDEVPFHFSLPEQNIFISTGLVKKYIKSEKILYCLVAYELIISEKNIYKKNIIIPTGSISTRRMLSLLRLKIDEKVEVHKWAFYILKRIGIDTDNYLSWLQIQNRNSVDFSLQLGDISSISREESLFKAFIISKTEKQKTKKYEGSSRAFYSFVKALKR